MTAAALKKELRRYADPQRRRVNYRFFKAEPGGYGEGDQFIGVKVPDTRKVVRRFKAMAPEEVDRLLESPVHEERLAGLLIMVHQFDRADRQGRKRIYDQYVAHMATINNWDLIDSSAPYIVGPWLHGKGRTPLGRWARSNDVWQRRIAIMATFHFVKQGEFDETLRLAELLLGDEHDLIHKAVGWMLREIGNRDRAVEESFLKEHYRDMPRTMLRYAIEKFPETNRKAFLHGRI